MKPLYAALDLGTTTSRLVVYSGGSVKASYTLPSPLHVGGGRAWHSGEGLVETVRRLAAKAAEAGAGVLGVSIYRASIASWLPGAREPGRVSLWLDYWGRASAWRRARRRRLFRLLSRLPLLGRYASPLSPLPTLIEESRGGSGRRVWSVDALVAEALTGRYATEPVNASLLAAFNSLTGRPSSLYRLLGYRGEAPEVVMHDEEVGRAGGVTVAGLIADQQAALLGSGCLKGGCASLVMGTGFFAQAPVSPWRAASAGLRGPAIPVPCLATSTGYTACVEVMGPGMGLALREAAELAGGFEGLGEAARGGCPLRETGIAIPYAPGAPVEPWTPRALLHTGPRPRGGRGMLCPLIGGLVAGLAALMEAAAAVGGVARLRAVGGAARASWLLEAAARLSGVTVEAYPGFEASAAGAALLAGLSAGHLSLGDVRDFSPGEPSAVYEGEGSGGVLGDWLAVLRGGSEGLYDALPRLLERIESSL